MAVVIVLAIWAFLIASVGIYRYVTGTIELSVNRFKNQLMVLERTRTTFAITSNGTTVSATKSKEKIKVARSHTNHNFPMPSNAIHRRRQILLSMSVACVTSTMLALVVSAFDLLLVVTLVLLGGYILALFVTAGLREGHRQVATAHPRANDLQRSRFLRPELDVVEERYFGTYGGSKVANFQ